MEERLKLTRIIQNDNTVEQFTNESGRIVRKRIITKKGAETHKYIYNDHGNIITDYIIDESITEDSLSDIAREVIEGKWSNMSERRQKLEKAGYDYNEVQAEVNRFLSRESICSNMLYTYDSNGRCTSTMDTNDMHTIAYVYDDANNTIISVSIDDDNNILGSSITRYLDNTYEKCSYVINKDYNGDDNCYAVYKYDEDEKLVGCIMDYIDYTEYYKYFYNDKGMHIRTEEYLNEGEDPDNIIEFEYDDKNRISKEIINENEFTRYEYED